MRLTQLDGLMAFVTVARARSFTAAASALEVTPPAVSQAVKQLEERLGVRLLHRTTRSVSLTEAGERYFERVAPAVAELLGASDALEPHRSGGVAGRLRINAPHLAFPLLLRPVLASFLQAHPQVQVEMALDDGFVDIVARGFDIGVRLGESVQRDMVAVPLTASERFALVASPAYVERHGLPTSPEQLRGHSCIRYRFPGSGAIYRWELQRRGRTVEVEVDGPLTVSDGPSMLQAALDGIGIAHTFERLAAHELAAGTLVPVLPRHWLASPGFHLYFASRHTSPAVRAFVDHCRAHAAALG
ncbi:LysR family transcriptional regulator [Ramlibacter sp.]|uniref:LysR family transcriptional regulator n=1 Tax=Ramlibacter sp. TaxID=1917967 RepID=UPI001796D348|nr:LysR family transcriptional regulator [Ramlibacter sp.]MBA2672567.1 LysR family transcriptional regulator [Ramlibacter sp.]